MAGSGADFLRFGLPSGRVGNLSILHPSLAGTKRADIGDEFMAMGSAALSKRFRSTESAASASVLSVVQAVLPAGLTATMNVIDTGLSTLESQTDEQMVHSLFAVAFPGHRWEQSYCDYTSLFVARDHEGERRHPGLYTVASVPVLNAILESAEAATGKGRRLSYQGNAAANAGAFYGAYTSLAATTAEEFGEKWNFAGHFTSQNAGGIYSSDAGERRSGGTQRQIGVSRWNRTNAFNLFSPSVRVGTRLYFTVRDFDVSETGGFCDPEGVTIARRSAFPATSLQVRGMTDTDCDMLPHASGCNSADMFWGDAGNVGATPRNDDADYVRREHAAAQGYVHFDFGMDDNKDIFVVRPLIEQEGITEAVANVPQLVWESYQEGVVYPVGVVREVKGARSSAANILKGHRSHEILKTLTRLELMGRSG